MLAVVKITFLGSLVVGQFGVTEQEKGTVSANTSAEVFAEAPAVTENLVAAAPDTLSDSKASNTTPDPAQTSDTQTKKPVAGQRTIPVLAPRSADAAAPAPIPTQVTAETAALALAQASAESAQSAQSAIFRSGTSNIWGTSVAHAADLPAVPPVAPPAPNVRPMESPITPQRVVRPDEITPQAPPAPEVAPFVSRDSSAQKQAELNRREQELLALQQQMESRMEELNSLENRLQGMLQDANNTQESKFKQLVDMYANMKPRQAAQALTSMDETIAVKILTGMKSKQSGEILSYMNPTHSARLSEVMSKMQM